jgi:hypothetical protein
MLAAMPEVQEGDELVRLSFLIPRSWRTELANAARAQSISKADLCRLVLRSYLRQRYEDEARAALETTR